MQLLLLIFALAVLGKNADINRVKPILEQFGGKEAQDILKRAEEIGGVLSAVQSMAKPGENVKEMEGERTEKSGYPLAPIADIADERITYALSRYIAMGN